MSQGIIALLISNQTALQIQNSWIKVIFSMKAPSSVSVAKTLYVAQKAPCSNREWSCLIVDAFDVD